METVAFKVGTVVLYIVGEILADLRNKQEELALVAEIFCSFKSFIELLESVVVAMEIYSFIKSDVVVKILIGNLNDELRHGCPFLPWEGARTRPPVNVCRFIISHKA